jgi:exosortase
MNTWSMSRVRLVLVALFAIGVIVANATPVAQLVTFARANSTASHILLVPAITLALLFNYRREILAEVSTGWVLGSLLLILAVAAAVLGRTNRAGDSGLSIQIAAMVLALIGGFVLGFGGRAFRVALFPLLFLAFAIPIPPPALAAITLFLKKGSADAVGALFSATGTPFHRDGFVFALPGTVIEVADECSGIRSSIALALTMLLTGHLYLQRGWTRLALLLAVLPVAVIKNGVRIVTLSLLALHVDPSFLTGQLHHDGGFVFFIIGLVMLAPVLALLRRADVMPAASSPL